MRILRGREALAFLEEKQRETAGPDEAVARSVTAIVEAVRLEGDRALRRFAERFGDTVPERILVEDEEREEAARKVPDGVRGLLGRAAQNIRAFAEAAMEAARPFRLDRPGFSVGMVYRPVERAGCYVPAGRHPLPSTALMTAIPARAAGVEEVVMVCPAPTPEVFCAAELAGVDRIYRIGGAQAVAALAFGTESVRRVDVVAGPGNAFVTEAKRQLLGRVGIDLLAGPSEVAVVADGAADPRRVALDLLAQWEHDPDARAWLLTDSAELAGAVSAAIAAEIEVLELPDFVVDSTGAAAFLVLDSLEDCALATERIAPEHLHVAVRDPESMRGRFRNYGALFLGYEATVPLGDYMAGPNHTLPTGRTARFSGGLSPWTFLRAQAWTEAGPEAAPLARDAAAFARIEGLRAHAAAAGARGGPESTGR